MRRVLPKVHEKFDLIRPEEVIFVFADMVEEAFKRFDQQIFYRKQNSITVLIGKELSLVGATDGDLKLFEGVGNEGVEEFIQDGLIVYL